MINNEEIDEVDEMPKIKVEAIADKQFFPKNNEKIEHGDFAILTWKIKKVLEGEPYTHPWFKTMTAKGNVCEIEQGEVYTIVATRDKDETWGIQYNIDYIFQPMDLTSAEDQRKFLSKILTEKQVNDLFTAFEKPLDYIASADIEKLITVKGIGEKTAERMINKYHLTKDYSKIYVELSEYDLTTNMINNLVAKYKSPDIVVSKIKENPYVLATEVHGVGFKKADEIALSHSMDWDSPNRVEAFILHLLNTEGEKGNSYVFANFLMYDIEDALGDISSEVIGQAMKSLVDSGKVGIDETNEEYKRVYLTKYKRLEQQVSDELLRIINGKNDFYTEGWEEKVKELEKEQGYNLTDEQWHGVKTVVENNVTLVTGLAGSGKTTIIKAFLEAMKGTGMTFAQTALSGRASSKMGEVTGKEGQTIHRLLGFNPMEWRFMIDEENPLEEDLIILDEISLVGGYIFLDLLKGIKTSAKLILIGDIAQLEAIGCMNLAEDLVKTVAIDNPNLTEIHRQAAKSGIVTESLKIRNGVQLFERGFEGIDIRGELEDFELDVSTDRETMKDRMIKHFVKWFDVKKNIMEVQLVVPIRERGDCCVDTLNEAVQDIYNPWSRNRKEVVVMLNKKEDKKYTLRESDKILISKNNYQTVNLDGKNTPIFNGWIGIIEEITTEGKGGVIIHFPIIKDTVIVPLDKLDTVRLGYANSVHSMQGSDCPIVIGGIDYSTPPFMLTRELVYTLVTRAEEHVVLVCQNGAIRDAIETSNVSEKNTFLREMLDEGVGKTV